MEEEKVKIFWWLPLNASSLFFFFAKLPHAKPKHTNREKRGLKLEKKN